MDVETARRRGARRVLLLLALVCIAPIVASYVIYYGLRPSARVNYGELLVTAPAPDIAGVDGEGAPLRLAALRGRWVLLTADDATCDARCEGKLYATRQARTMQGAERERVVRLWLRPADAPAPPAAMRAAHPDLTIMRAEQRQWDALPGPGGARANIYLLDPLGNLVLRYPADPDIKGLAKDLERLLRASQIG